MQYRNPWDRMRIGRVLEDLDSLAGNIAFKHCNDGLAATLPPLLVTAAVERIALRKPLLLTHDVKLGVARSDCCIPAWQAAASATCTLALCHELPFC